MTPSLTESSHDYATGGASSTADLTPALYSELRRIASRRLSGERSNHTLQATALVHEAWLKLSGARERSYSDHTHFLAVAARVMRQVLVDHARSRSAQKRLGDSGREPLPADLGEVNAGSGPDLVELIQLDRALAALAHQNETMARLVEMRYFGGMTAEESAEVLGVSVHAARHDLRFAQAWLRKRLSR